MQSDSVFSKNSQLSISKNYEIISSDNNVKDKNHLKFTHFLPDKIEILLNKQILNTHWIHRQKQN